MRANGSAKRGGWEKGRQGSTASTQVEHVRQEDVNITSDGLLLTALVLGDFRTSLFSFESRHVHCASD